MCQYKIDLGVKRATKGLMGVSNFPLGSGDRFSKVTCVFILERGGSSWGMEEAAVSCIEKVK